ncbi:MAG: response regulator [Nitrospiraceae bacterium]|nr:response regulator [Nitrospiraceae bacterium]
MESNRRFYLRIFPSKSDPVGIAFREKQLSKAAPLIRVKDISIGGVGLELSDAMPGREGLFLPGTRIEEIGLKLPFEGPCIFSGVVRFMYEALRGIEFLLDHVEQEKIARYVYKRQIEMLGRNTSFWTEDNRGKNKNFDADRYKWITGPESLNAGQILRKIPGKKKILVIDPSPEGIENYCTFLSSCDEFEAYPSDGAHAAETALEIKPDLILIDLSSPDPEGNLHNSMRRLKRYPITSQIPVFMVTGNGKDAVLTAMRYGADDFIIKTAGEEFILGRIKEHFNKP